MRSRNACQIGAGCPGRRRRHGRALGDEVGLPRRAKFSGAKVDRAGGRAEQERVCIPLINRRDQLLVATGETDDVGDHGCRAQLLGQHLGLVDIEAFDLALEPRPAPGSRHGRAGSFWSGSGG